MKNLLLLFMMLFAIDSIAQLDQREKGDVISPALNKNPNFIQKTGWTIEAIDPINDTLCSVTPSSDNLTILTASDCNARVYQDINSADIRKARFDKETMTAFLKLQSLTYVKITLNVYKKAATTGTLTLLRTRSIENNSNVPLRDKKIVFDVVTDDLNFVTNANLADSLRIEFTFEPTVVFPAGVAKVEVNDFRVFSSLMNYSPLLHEVREESGWTEWQPITITADVINPTKGTVSFDGCRKKRDGTQLEVEFILHNETGGTTGSGIYYFSCGGLTLNGEALTPDYDSVLVTRHIGTGLTNALNAEANLDTSGRIRLIANGDYVGSGTQPIASGRYYRFNVSIPIKEWKQSSVAASDLGPKQIMVFAKAGNVQTLSVGSASTVQLNLKTLDTHGAFNTSNYTFTSPTRTCYDVHSVTRFNASATPTDIFSAFLSTNSYRDAGIPFFGRFSSQALTTINGSKIVCLNQGGTLRLQAYTDGVRALENDSALQIVERPEHYIVRAGLKESMIVKDVEKVRLYAYSTVMQSVTENVQADRIFPTVDTDTHGIYNPTTGIATIPRDGNYSVTCTAEVTGTASMVMQYINGGGFGGHAGLTYYSSGDGPAHTITAVKFYSKGHPVGCKFMKTNAGQSVGSTNPLHNRIVIEEL